MIKRDPSETIERLPHQALKYFTNREKVIQVFQRYLDLPANGELKTLVYYGVGGIGKTALQFKLSEILRTEEPSLPYARIDLTNIGDRVLTDRKVLLNLRADLEKNFGIMFPRFELLLAVIVAHEGGDTEPLVREYPVLRDTINFAASLLQAPVAGLSGLVDTMIRKSPRLEKRIRHVFKTEEVIRLRERAREEDNTLPGELIRYFVWDLMENLPQRTNINCRCVLFLDAYESLRIGGSSTHLHEVDTWVRELVDYCTHVGVLPVISGRDRLAWDTENPKWAYDLDQHLLGGLSSRDTQLYLAKCDIGKPPDKDMASPLQEAIITCCREDTKTGEIACHSLYLALCAEIVLNTRRSQQHNPSPDLFAGIPHVNVAQELTNRFLKSLDNQAMRLWVKELNLTPRFDEETALKLDFERNHYNGQGGWKLLAAFSFLEAQEDGFYRFHKVMSDVLKKGNGDSQKVHEWFCRHWSERSMSSLSWYHRWLLEPEKTLQSWKELHEDAIKQQHIGTARELLGILDETALDANDRQIVGDRAWADTHLAIGYALWETPQLTMGQVLTASIEHYNEALKVYTETDFPLDWAGTQNNLGNAYGDLPVGDRGRNMQNAIDCYEAALRVYTETEFPLDWAMTQNNLGIAYWDLPAGDRGQNMQNAIDCYEAALRILTETEFPREWATTQNNLGTAYGDLPAGDRGRNMQNAIDCYEAALRILTETEFPREWAMTQYNLGLAYQNLPAGDRGQNMQNAIECYEAALRVHTETDFPLDWAMTQYNLGIAYGDLPAGDRGQNMQKAIQCFEAALRVYIKTDFPLDWAMTQNKLGVAYADLPAGDRGRNMQKAIDCYEAALRVYIKTDFPLDWAMTQYILGIAFGHLPAGDRGQNMQNAIDCYEATLRVYTKTDFPLQWAMTQNNLGIAYAKLPAGDKGQNLQNAIDCYEAALRVRTETDFPLDWAMTQNNLGNAYSYLPAGDRGQNMQNAIDCYEAALRIYTETEFPREWAIVQENIKNV